MERFHGTMARAGADAPLGPRGMAGQYTGRAEVALGTGRQGSWAGKGVGRARVSRIGKNDLRFQGHNARSGGFGEVAEWLKAPHSKCGILARVSRVRIPPSPPTDESRESEDVHRRQIFLIF